MKGKVNDHGQAKAAKSSASKSGRGLDQEEGSASFSGADSFEQSSTQSSTQARGQSSEQASSDQGSEARSVVGQLNAAKEALADELGSFANKIDALAPKSGALGNVGSSVSGGLSQAQRFLLERTASDVATLAFSALRRNPLPFAMGAIGAGLGFMISRHLEARAAAEDGAYGSDRDVEGREVH